MKTMDFQYSNIRTKQEKRWKGSIAWNGVRYSCIYLEMGKERCQSTIHNLLIDSEESTVGFGMENDSKLQYTVDVYNLNNNDIDKFIFP